MIKKLQHLKISYHGQEITAIATRNGNSHLIHEIKKEKLLGEAKEGDVLNVDEDLITIDHEDTEKRKKEIVELVKGLWK